MNRAKLVVFITAILLSGITALIAYAAHTPSPGSAGIIATNPPYQNKTWQFYATTSVDVCFENISNYVAIISVQCANTSTGTEYYTLLPKEMTGIIPYITTPYVNNPTIEWAFNLGIPYRAQIVGTASWK